MRQAKAPSGSFQKGCCGFFFSPSSLYLRCLSLFFFLNRSVRRKICLLNKRLPCPLFSNLLWSVELSWGTYDAGRAVIVLAVRSECTGVGVDQDGGLMSLVEDPRVT